jgi:hypothetical protein
MYSVAEFWYEYSYFDIFFGTDVYNVYSVNSTSTIVNYEGAGAYPPC